MKKCILLLAIFCPPACWSFADAGREAVGLVQSAMPAVVLVRAYDANGLLIGQGNGFFIDNKGSVITNHHVIEGAHSAAVKTSAGREYSVRDVVAKNAEADIVKLSIKAADSNISFLKFSESLPAEGQNVVVVSSSLCSDSNISTGVISAVRDIPAFGKIFQMTASVSAGSGGSPVLNSKGEAIGIAIFVLTKGRNIGFTISGDKILAMKDNEKTPLYNYVAAVSDVNDISFLCEKGLKELWQENWSEALVYFQDATEKNPQAARAWLWSGYCYGKLGYWQKAMEAFKDAVRIKPNLADAYYNLGVAYGKLGRYEDAVEAYKQAMKVKPDCDCSQ